MCNNSTTILVIPPDNCAFFSMVDKLLQTGLSILDTGKHLNLTNGPSIEPPLNNPPGNSEEPGCIHDNSLVHRLRKTERIDKSLLLNNLEGTTTKLPHGQMRQIQNTHTLKPLKLRILLLKR